VGGGGGQYPRRVRGDRGDGQHQQARARTRATQAGTLCVAHGPKPLAPHAAGTWEEHVHGALLPYSRRPRGGRPIQCVRVAAHCAARHAMPQRDTSCAAALRLRGGRGPTRGGTGRFAALTPFCWQSHGGASLSLRAGCGRRDAQGARRIHGVPSRPHLRYPACHGRDTPCAANLPPQRALGATTKSAWRPGHIPALQPGACRAPYGGGDHEGEGVRAHKPCSPR